MRAPNLLEKETKTWYNRAVNTECEKYTIIRSKRRTLSLSVKADGEIVVRAPYGTRTGEIDAFVASHAQWIEKRRNLFSRFVLDLSDGAALKLYGKEYVIAEGRAKLTDGILFLPREGRVRAFTALAKKIARVQMTHLAEMYAREYGFTYKSIRITSARGRWGSCNALGALAFSFRTVFLNEEQARYIVVHELCHTRHLDHSRAFWAEVGKILPSYAAVRSSLRKTSAVMNWL